MDDRSLLAWTFAAALAGVAGCVAPGELNVTLLSHYQRAMAGKGGQPRLAEEGLGSLRPAPSEAVPDLPVEDIVTCRIVETTETYELLGSEKLPEAGKEVKRIDIRRTVKTTTFERDANTGQLVPRVSVDERRPIPSVVDQVPQDLHEVEVYRQGAHSGLPALIRASKKLIPLSLQEAILRALAGSLDIRVVSYDPAIAREEMVKAAAAFDYTVFGAATYAKDERQAEFVFASDITRIRDWSLGVRQRTISGAEWSLEWAMSRTWDNSTFSNLRTRYEPTMVLQVVQPLLRNAWPQFNLAQLRVARINSRITDAEFRAQVEDVITRLIAGYWQLVQARRNLEIQQRLLAETKRSYERVRGRVIIDATMATIKQVEASVRIRQAALIVERKNIVDAQESLARLMADPQVNLLSGYEVVPTTAPMQEQIHISAQEQLLTGLRHNPLLEQARLAIAAADVSVSVAENQTLPALNLTASTGLQGLERNPDSSHRQLLRGDYASYSIGLQLEYPVGNRERRANFRQRRYELTKAIVTMQNIADQVAVAVNERVRQIQTSYEEMLAQQAAVEAARVQLQALEDTEEIRARLTPEFLRVKLQAQETLANSERAALLATVSYNTALAELARTAGTVLELNRVEIALPHIVRGTWPQESGPATVPATVPAVR